MTCTHDADQLDCEKCFFQAPLPPQTTNALMGKAQVRTVRQMSALARPPSQSIPGIGPAGERAMLGVLDLFGAKPSWVSFAAGHVTSARGLSEDNLRRIVRDEIRKALKAAIEAAGA